MKVQLPRLTKYGAVLKRTKGTWLFFLYLFLILFVCVGYFFQTDGKNGEKRYPASQKYLELKPGQKPGHIETREIEGRLISYRAPVVPREIQDPLLAAVQFMVHTPDFFQLDQSGSSELSAMAPLLPQDGSAMPRLFVDVPKGLEEPLDLTGAPLRWRLPENLVAGYSLPRKYPVFIKPPEPLPPLPRLPQTASSYRTLVENFARRFNLSVPLVMAIIHSESDFSPSLVSHKSAMGLMQLLPSTASGEVHRFLYGKSGQVGFEDLRIPEINIRYGTAYLHILLNRYFPQIKDREIREICAIAAYNLGPNRFVRLYGPTPEAAAAVINQMDLEEFLQDVQTRLPSRETKAYVEKVRRMKNHYAGLY